MMGIGHTPIACVVLTVGGREHRVHLKLEMPRGDDCGHR